jgi:hypothetical protein
METILGEIMNNEVKVTKCPPGEAEGARDLQTWSMQRTLGSRGFIVEGRREKKRGKRKLITLVKGRPIGR